MTVVPFGNIGVNISAYQDAFGQSSISNQSSYKVYQNNNEGVSIEYPDNWTYSEMTQGGRMVTAFSPHQGSATVVQVFYDKTTSYVGTDQQKRDRLPQIINEICSGATIAKLGFSCSNFQYKNGIGNYSGVPAYVMISSMTETFSDGSSREQDMAQFLVIEQNSDYGILASCPTDQCKAYSDELNHFVSSLDIYSIKNKSNGLSSMSQHNSMPQQNTPAQSANYTIPSWIKNNAKWWAEGQLSDADFVQGIQYLVQQGIIIMPTTQTSSQSSQGIPAWVKNTAKWWAEGQLQDPDFIKSVQYLVQNGIISIQNIDQSQTAVTDPQGVVTFQIKGQNVPFTFVDNATGLPLSGLDVAFALEPKTQSVGILLVIDPAKHYPLQIITLTGDTTNSNVNTAWKNPLIPSAYAEVNKKVMVSVFSDPRTVGSLLLVGFLGPVGAEIGDKAATLYSITSLAAKAADKNGWLAVSSYLENHGFMTGTTTLEKAKEEIQTENEIGKTMSGIFLIGSGGVNKGGYFVGRTLDKSTEIMDMSTVSGCDPQTEEIKWVQVGFTRIYSCTNNKAYGLVKYDPPAESGHVSLDLLSKANAGFGEKIQADKGQPVPVPADDYSMRVSAPDTTPVTEDITVTPEQITDVTVAPKPIQNNAMTTVITPAGDLSGTWSGSFSMTDYTSDGCSFSGTWQATATQDGNDLSGTFILVSASSPQYPDNDYCTLIPNDSFEFQGTVSSSSFNISGSDFSAKGSFTTDLIRGTFDECSDGSCAKGSFTGMRTG